MSDMVGWSRAFRRFDSASVTMDENKNIEYDLADIIMGKPNEFTVGRKVFRLYPVTLAKTYLLKRYMDELPIDNDFLTVNPYMETLRLVNDSRKTCCEILAIHTTPNTYKDFCNNQSMANRRNVFSKMKDEDLATLLIHVLTSDKTASVMAYLGLDKESERMAKVLEVKAKNKSSLSFFGLSIFGSFIAQLKEMGYSDNEILYERGYSFLKLMVEDKIKTLYLSDEEMQRIPALATGPAVMDANDPSATGEIMTSLANRGIRME